MISCRIELIIIAIELQFWCNGQPRGVDLLYIRPDVDIFSSIKAITVDMLNESL